MNIHFLKTFFLLVILFVSLSCASPKINEDMFISDCDQGDASQSCTEKEFIELMKYKMIKHLTYPLEARNSRQEGLVKLEILLEKSGEVRWVRLVESSGIRSLDRAAVNVVNDSAPYYTIPKSFNKDQLTIPLSINFTVEFKTINNKAQFK